MNVNLSPELEQLLNDKLKSGEYRSADEVINAAMGLLKERGEDYAVLRRVNGGEPLPVDERFDTRLTMLLQEAEDSEEPAEMTADDWDDIEREALDVLNSRKPA
jgi:putative addiction module CopG family antidote